MHRFKRVEDEAVTSLRALEKELGVVVLAIEPKLHVADLTDQQLDRLRSAERDLGVVLIAYDAHSAFLAATS